MAALGTVIRKGIVENMTFEVRCEQILKASHMIRRKHSRQRCKVPQLK